MTIRINYHVFIFSCLLLLLSACTQGNSQSQKIAEKDAAAAATKAVKPAVHPKGFNDYWYSGKAELSRYELQQNRYGELHEGDAVMIFVTEDFRADKQVKYEGGSRENVVPVLKLNFTRKFLTGIYPYSMMTSVFTPINYNQPTLKTATSSQEWCGHTYDQLNYRNGQYEGMLRSYFQNEGDREFKLPGVVLEDELWAKVRLNPEGLPTGKINLIPGATFLRLKHLEHNAEAATASLSDVSPATSSAKALKKYRVEYIDIPRVLEITFENEFPYTIVKWTEETKKGFGGNETLTTTATLTNTSMRAYWGENSNKDRALRAELGLDSK